METRTLVIIAVAVSAVNLLLALITIILSRKKTDLSPVNQKLSDIEYGLADTEKNVFRVSENLKSFAGYVSGEFSNTRSENRQSSAKIAEEMRTGLENANEKMQKMNAALYEQRIEQGRQIASELEKIRQLNAEQNERQNRIITDSLTQLRQNNEEKLEQMRQTVDEKLTATLNQRLDSSFKTVSEQLENLYKSLGEMKELSSGVTDNVTSLSKILTNVKSRGTWAEIQLEGILDQTIPGMYDKNVVTVPGRNERVEFAVRIPSNDKKDDIVYLPIDSKFPMEDYIRLSAAAERGDTAGVLECRKAIEQSVIRSAKEICKYINEPYTTPFAIMYLATEGLYSEIISSPNGIAEKIHREMNVLISGPSTVTALLNSLAMGFRAIAINEKAGEVRTVLSAVKAQYENFEFLLDKAKKRVEAAGTTIEEAQKRNSIINRKLKNFEGLDSGESSEILELPMMENDE